MRPTVPDAPAHRIAAFTALLAVVFACALGLGAVIGPVEPSVAGDQHRGHAGHDEAASTSEGSEMSMTHDVGALATSRDGYTLSLAAGELPAGRSLLRFTIAGPDGAPLTDYEVQHEKRLHLIVVRRDLTGFQHLHPTLDPATGQWQVPASLTPGSWRVIADFVAGSPAGTPSGESGIPEVLGSDLQVAGDYRPRPLGPQRHTSRVGPYRVELSGDLSNGLVAGGEAELTLRVTRAGREVTDLQPYLGANGHLVALRAGDLGYLHVHPQESDASGPSVGFHTSVPSSGRYRLFFDFKHQGVVRTAVFDLDASPGTGGGHSDEHDH